MASEECIGEAGSRTQSDSSGLLQLLAKIGHQMRTERLVLERETEVESQMADDVV